MVRRYILLLMALSLGAFSLQAQVPKPVLEGLQEGFGKSARKSAVLEAQGQYFSATWQEDSHDRFCYLDSSGKILDETVLIPATALPVKLIEGCAEAYPGYEVQKARLFSRQDLPFPYFELELLKGKDRIGATFAPDGHMIEEAVPEGEDE